MPKTRKHLTPTEAEAKGLLCRKHLKERLRLMPGLNTKPAGSVWQGQGAYDVYNPAECVPWRWMPGRAQVRRQHVAAQAKDLIAAGCIVLDTATTGLGDAAETCETTTLDVTGAPHLATPVRPRWPSSTPPPLLAEPSLPTTSLLMRACCGRPIRYTDSPRQC